MTDESDLTSADDTADQAAQVAAAMAEARARLAEVPAEVVVTNHVMGLYELGAIHLSSDTPDLASASLAIDSMALLVDGLGDRLGDDAPTLRDALANIRMAFVGLTARAGQSTGAAGDDPTTAAATSGVGSDEPNGDEPGGPVDGDVGDDAEQPDV